MLSNGGEEIGGYGIRSIQTVIIYNDEEQVEFTEDDFIGVIVIN